MYEGFTVSPKRLVAVLCILTLLALAATALAFTPSRAQIQPTPDAPVLFNPHSGAYDYRLDPALALQSFFNAISLRDFPRALGYWGGSVPGGKTYAAWVAGYNDTAYVNAFVRLPSFGGAAAGSTYVSLPTLALATQTDGTQQVFAGCYTLCKSNVPVGDAPTPDPNWYLYSAAVKRATWAEYLSAANLCEAGELKLQNVSASAVNASPVDLLTSFYSAILSRDYRLAYGLWEKPPRDQTLQQFADGYANTADITVYLSLATTTSGAAGSTYLDLPVVLFSTQIDGTRQRFGGCLLARLSNFNPETGWLFSTGSASVRAVVSDLDAFNAAVCPA
jgi:hypothetical protein